TIVYAADKTTVLADLHPSGYQHYYEPLSAMGTSLPDAIVAIEDRNFYSEPGVDPAGIARAAVVDIKAHDTVEGASTITQQLVKVRLLDSSPTIQRKMTEALLAFSVERRFSKSQILEMYLNSVSFGNSAVGTAAAYGGGLRVYTTLNMKLQDIGQAAISNTQSRLAWRNVQQGALVAIDPSSGAIIAMVSSANPKSNGGQYNLAVWPPRNPGS